MNNSFAIGVLTANRPILSEQCLQSLQWIKSEKTFVFNNPDHNIAYGKNQIIQDFLGNTKSNYLFILEEDVKVVNPRIFYDYIEFSKQSGLQHLLWGLAGPNNLKDNPITKIKNLPDIRFGVKYPDFACVFFKHCVGVFNLYTREVFNTVGLMDEHFENALEHVEFSQRIVNAGFLPSYGLWPDVTTSFDSLVDLDPNFEFSTMKEKNRVNQNVIDATELFTKKCGFSPYVFQDIKEAEVVKKLQEIQAKYGSN
jgi:hypothetical protein